MLIARTASNAPLAKPLRAQLENTVKAARDVAEKATSAALVQLAVGEAKTPDYLNVDQKALRRRLRAHGRALGDIKHEDNTQGLQHLVGEVAYEHWHRMLFARFLAENGLLMWEPDAAVTLDDCRDIVGNHPDIAMGAKSHWELAGKLAARMLPQVFKPQSPVFELIFAPEQQRELENLLANLPELVFEASDSLGWVYQFWQSKRKDEINASEVKIGADELPAVTQLFTEPYMVEYLLHNTLGAWWQTHHEHKPCPVTLTYLRTVDDGRPAAGNFDGWPRTLKEFKLLDPCCGSGHFLVGAFLMLVPMRVAADGLSLRDAIDAVLSENLHGLEIDPRCVEVAAFALALAAWRYPGTGGYRRLPELNIACTGLPIAAEKEQWLALAGDNKNLVLALAELYQQFKDAPILGSLIDFERGLSKDSLFETNWEEVEPLLTQALSGEEDGELAEFGVVAKGVSRAAALLSQKYHLVVTNPPYLVRGKQSSKLQGYLAKYYKFGDADISTVFIERFNGFLKEGGAHASVTPLNWYFLKSYKNLREDLLRKSCIKHIAKIGSGATAKASWDVLRALTIVVKHEAKPSDEVTGVEAPSPDEASRAVELRSNAVLRSTVAQIQRAPDAKFVLGLPSDSKPLSEFVHAYQGLATADFARFGRKFWELFLPKPEWEFQHSTFANTDKFVGLEHVLHWERGVGALANSSTARIQGIAAHGKPGVVITQTRSLPATLYVGQFFDNNVSVLIPKNQEVLPAVWCYVASSEYNQNVRKLDEKLGVTNATLAKVPFDLERWEAIAAEQFPNGLPEPHSDNPTQWIFHGHPCASTNPLQVAVARLLGYRWPTEFAETAEVSVETSLWIARCKDLVSHVDDDGIVCLQPVRGEKPAHERLLALLIDAWETVNAGSWKSAMLDKLLTEADCAGRGLDVWLRDNFFEQHARYFQYRPFIWHVWDGLKDGFGALVNYHGLDAKKLERLIHTYLGDWIRTQEAGVANGTDGASQRLAAAKTLKTKLEVILDGDAPYDIFVRWKSPAQQPIGFNPDLNDGVRLNIRPFMTAEVLRHNKKPKLNISWDKDRGKDVEDAPWFNAFTGERINDHHLTLAEKRAAREKQT